MRLGGLGLKTFTLPTATGFATSASWDTSADATPATPSAPARSVLSHRWDDLPEPATETVWCAREDAVYAACGDHDRLRTELLH